MTIYWVYGEQEDSAKGTDNEEQGTSGKKHSTCKIDTDGYKNHLYTAGLLL